MEKKIKSEKNDDEKSKLKKELKNLKIDENVQDWDLKLSFLENLKKVFEKCGSVKYGSTKTKQNWYICPKIWCPSCKLSLEKGELGGDKKDRCPICSRVVIDRANFYGDKMFGWPGFLKNSQHPNNLWLPCCYQSKEVKVAKTQVRDSIFNAYGIDTTTDDNNGYVIKINSKMLDKGRYGTLPNCIMDYLTKENKEYNLSILKAIASKKVINIKNIQEDTKFNFYRRGLGNEVLERDFVSLIANIYSSYSKKTVKRGDIIKLIVENLTIEKFLTINRGILDILFRDIDERISSFQNFIEYIQSNEFLDYNYLWELCTDKNPWLFKEGINLILVECMEGGLNVLCPPFPNNFNTETDLAIAIKYNTNDTSIFEQIVHNVYFMSSNIKYDTLIQKSSDEYKTFIKLKDTTDKCGVSPNISLLSNIMKKNRKAATPIQFPLLNVMETSNSLSDSYKIVHYITNNYNKIFGILVKHVVSKNNIFVPVYPSGKRGIDQTKLLNMDSDSDVFYEQLDKFTETYKYLKKLFILQLKRLENIVEPMNTLPMEIILDKSKTKIVAIITISNSIVPIRETPMEGEIIDGYYTWEDSDKSYRIKISDRQYYLHLDKFIRQKPIGIFKYSPETTVQYMVEELDMNITNIYSIKIGKKVFLFINFDNSEIALPFSYNNSNKEFTDSYDIKKITMEELPKKDLIRVIEYCNNVWNKANKMSKFAPFRPIRYKMDTIEKIIHGLILENSLIIPILDTGIMDENLSMIDNTIIDKYDKQQIDYYLGSESRDARIKLTAKLDYEEEIFNIIKYEFSLYLQSKVGQKDRKKIINILDNVFDLLHTRKAREDIFKILNKFIRNYGSIIYDTDMGIIESRLENYHVPVFREKLTKSSSEDCDNPHYIWRENKGKPIKKGCKIIIPKDNLIHTDLQNNKNNKLYRIVDEIIRDKNIRLEIIDGLFPKSIDDRKYTRLSKNEIIITDSELVEDRYTTLYKLNNSPNLRRDEYNIVVDTFDFTQPEMVEPTVEDEANALKKYLDNVNIVVEITRTGDTGYLFE